MRATNLVIGLSCLLATVTLMNAALGPALGINLVTGEQHSVDHTKKNLTSDVDTGITDQGRLSPLTAAKQFVSMITHLTSSSSILYNLGVPAAIANWLTGPMVFVMALGLVALVIRTRL
ncbi:hypothetical protein A4G99_03805 [Haladaptatus sp. R4]|uniref:hypothetical protein n=1 Tax=Haladaptatus sp. R4 TaxID=1679489 RepID=UPI0007B48CB9|nr:hypothetical protein [Haladaptatus sp. R4]KZN25605.1 hypothetical protein A4G99_03805 [Haladaptatus sp. R4]